MGKTKTAFVSDIPADEKKGKKANKPQTDADVTQELEAQEENKKTVKAPKQRGKSYLEKKALVDPNKKYTTSHAVELVKKTSYSKFDGSVELHATVKKDGLSVNVNLPHSTGKTKKIEIADDKTIEKLQKGTVDFDVLLATADMMPKLVPFARILGPKGLMPNPKNGTLIKDKKSADSFSASTMTVKTEKKAPLIHTTFGKVSQDEKQLEENLEAVVEAIGKRQILKAFIKASMGPSIKLQF